MHDTSTLVRLEQKLSVRGTIQNDEFFRPRSFFVLSTNARKPLPSTVAVIARNNEQGPRFHFVCREVRCCTEKHDAINLPRCGLDRCIPSSSAAEATSDNRYCFGTMRLQVANRSEYVILKGRVIEVSLAGTGRTAESTEIECQNSKSFGYQNPGLIPPALLVESAAVNPAVVLVHLPELSASATDR